MGFHIYLVEIDMLYLLLIRIIFGGKYFLSRELFSFIDLDFFFFNVAICIQSVLIWYLATGGLCLNLCRTRTK